MGIMVQCAKGCGKEIEVTTEAQKEMVELGRNVTIAHSDCLEPAKDLRRYHVVISVYEVQPDGTETLDAQVGDYAEGSSFSAASTRLGEELNEQWLKVLDMASIIDGDSTIKQLEDEEEERPQDTTRPRNVLRGPNNEEPPSSGLIMI